jgi:hypothetical protein
MAIGGLFDEAELYGENNEPIESVDITTTILYMSREELKEFKTLCKDGIKEMFGQEFQQRGNLTDFLLTVLRERKNGTTYQSSGSPIQIKIEEAPDPSSSGSDEGEVPFGW